MDSPAMAPLQHDAAPGACGAMEALLAPTRPPVDAALESLMLAAAAGGAPPRLVEAMRYALLAGGKRVRPFLVLEAARVCGGAAEAALPGACAVEMVHAFSLVQDDLPCMDDELERRGRPTSHRVFGEAVALLAADSLLTLAFELLGRSGEIEAVGPRRALRAVQELAAAIGARGMAGGQAAELVLTAQTTSADSLAAVHRLKTGMLIAASLRIGAVLGGGDDEALGRLGAAGMHLGAVYQLVDDLVDLRHHRGPPAALEVPNLARLLGESEAARRARLHAAAADAELARFGARSNQLRGLVACLASP